MKGGGPRLLVGVGDIPASGPRLGLEGIDTEESNKSSVSLKMSFNIVTE